MDIIVERYEIAVERIKLISGENGIKKPFGEFFKRAANSLIDIFDLYEKSVTNQLDGMTLDELKDQNRKLFSEVYEDNYEESFLNPKCAVSKLGQEYGQILCYLYARNKGLIVSAITKDIETITLRAELFIEIYNYFEQPEMLSVESVKDTVYSFEKDNTEIFREKLVRDMVDPQQTYFVDIVMNSNLDDVRYLYKYGKHIGDNEIKMAQFLNQLSQEKIDLIAKVYTEGYRKGFVNTGKDLSIKNTVDIRYNIGFERIVRAAIGYFNEMGLKPVIYSRAIQTTSPNKQYEFDHKFDEGLYLDKAYVKRALESVENAFEEYKELAAKMAGPAVIEVFGEVPFEPTKKEQAIALTEEQQKDRVDFITRYQQIVQKYIKGEERSFTIIAFPIPEFGDNFSQMFEETIRINTLDEEQYNIVQQKIIDALDKAEYVRVTGKGNNDTHICVSMNDLKNPEKETNFENCLADVNIPLGEVFTSPKLEGTNGLLHVSQVYLNGLNFKDLRITFEDGLIKDYTCKNFESEEDNKKYIKENIMFNHPTLPIGEFAIGTNTTAYVIANKYNVIYKLPILIVEKMGPHFAVGDTCYSFSEEIKVYNPNGKEIVAKDNEKSLLRKTDISKAYFGCHTDITIPYEELGQIVAVTKDGEEIVIISDGRFVLEGTEMLNEPFGEND